MIFLVTALFEEAKPFINFYKLKPVNDGRFTIFENADSWLKLCVTGPGQVACASALSHMLTLYGASRTDFVVNVGTCAGSAPVGSLFLINKITDQATGRTYFPDVIYQHNFSESAIITSDTPVNGTASEAGSLVDMESSALYQAATLFVNTDRVIMLKIVSDNFDGSTVSRDLVSKLIDSQLAPITDFIARLAGMPSEEAAIDESLAARLTADLCCSAVMEGQLLQYLTYASLSGLDYTAIIDTMYEEGRLPCANRKEGKLSLEYFKQQII